MKGEQMQLKLKEGSIYTPFSETAETANLVDKFKMSWQNLSKKPAKN